MNPFWRPFLHFSSNVMPRKLHKLCFEASPILFFQYLYFKQIAPDWVVEGFCSSKILQNYPRKLSWLFIEVKRKLFKLFIQTVCAALKFTFSSYPNENAGKSPQDEDVLNFLQLENLLWKELSALSRTYLCETFWTFSFALDFQISNEAKACCND